MAGDSPRKLDDVEVFVIGEAPGANEDRKGIPFIGESGRILRNELKRNNLTNKTYITNLVKCRPPNNRTPTAAEIKACRPYLEEEIADLKHTKPLIVFFYMKGGSDSKSWRQAAAPSAKHSRRWRASNRSPPACSGRQRQVRRRPPAPAPA